METMIYREPENQELIINEKAREEHQNLLQEMGLKAPAEPSTSVNVYPLINSGMKACLKAICPTATKLEEYDSTVIPLEVLKVIKHCKEHNVFPEGFEIWHNDKDPDPMVVGYRYANQSDKENGYSWAKKRYLIARWGDCALPLTELLEKGKTALRASCAIAAKRAYIKAKMYFENPELLLEKAMSGSSEQIYITDSDGRASSIHF